MPRALGMAGEVTSGRAFRGGGEGTGEGRGDRVARRGEPPRERRARDDRSGDEGRPRGGRPDVEGRRRSRSRDTRRRRGGEASQSLGGRPVPPTSSARRRLGPCLGSNSPAPHPGRGAVRGGTRSHALSCPKWTRQNNLLVGFFCVDFCDPSDESGPSFVIFAACFFSWSRDVPWRR